VHRADCGMPFGGDSVPSGMEACKAQTKTKKSFRKSFEAQTSHVDHQMATSAPTSGISTTSYNLRNKDVKKEIVGCSSFPCASSMLDMVECNHFRRGTN